MAEKINKTRTPATVLVQKIIIAVARSRKFQRGSNNIKKKIVFKCNQLSKGRIYKKYEKTRIFYFRILKLSATKM